jgi:dihydrofolate reductase
MKLTIVVAMTPDRVIGRNGELPWRLPADLARFKRLTMGHPLIMGRKTFQSIGRPLPGRTSIVLTRDPSFSAEVAIVVGNIDEALARAAACPGGDEAFVIGGGEIYRQTLARAESMLVTLVNASIAGDAWFPIIDPALWRMVSSEHRPADDRNEFDLEFQTFQHRASLGR